MFCLQGIIHLLGNSTHTIKPGINEAWSLCVSPADDVLASGSESGIVNIWNMQNEHELIAKLDTKHRQSILSTCFSADGQLASSSIDGNVHLFDLESQKVG